MSPATKEEDENWGSARRPRDFTQRDKADPEYWRSQYQRYAIGAGVARGVHHPRGAHRRDALTQPRGGRARPRCGTIPLWRSSSRARRRIPDYPVADGYALPDESRCSPPTSRPSRRSRGRRGGAARAAGANRYPDPSNSALRRALSARYGVPANRIAIGNGSCDILLAAGEALLEPGAEIVYAWPSFCVYPHLAAASGASAIKVPLDDDQRHDLDAMAREITVATRLVIVCNPNNPTWTALPFDDIAAFVERVPPHVAVILDEAYCEFNLLDDPDATVDLLERHPTSCCCGRSRRPTGSAGCASATRCAARRPSRAPSTRFASRSSSTAPPRPPRSRRSSTRTRWPSASSARSRRASRSRTASNDLGIEPAESQANFCWFDLPEGGDEAAVVRASPSAACWCAPGRRSVARARCA